MNRVRNGLLILLVLLGASELDAQRRSRGRRGRGPSEYEVQHESVRAAFRDVVDDVVPSTVRVLVDGDAVGFGAIVDESGLVVTKASLLRRDADADTAPAVDSLACRLSDGRELEGTLLGVDDETDLALLGVPAPGVEPLCWTDEHAVGSWVATVAQDELPRVVGILSVEARRFTPVSRRRDPRRGFLGVRLETSNRGPRVTEVVEDSAAASGGVRARDVILRLGGGRVRSVEDFVASIGRRRPGDVVEIVVARGEDQKKLSVTLGRAPPEGRAQEDRWGGGPFSKRRYGFGEVLAHDSKLRPDDCGGPLVGLDGRAVGLNIARALRATSYALPAKTVKDVVARLASEASPLDIARASWIDPTGIGRGTLVIAGEGDVAAAARQAFLEAAGSGRVVVIASDGDGGDNDNGGNGDNDDDDAVPSWLAELPEGRVERVTPGAEIAPDATGVWLSIEASGERRDALESALRRVLDAGGVVGASGKSAPALGTGVLAGEDRLERALDILPGSVIELGGDGGAAARESAPAGVVGWTLDRDAALVCHGRRIDIVGSGRVTVRLGRSMAPAKAPRRDELTAPARLDLTALRRAAVDRASTAFPVAEKSDTELGDGALVIVGGGGLPDVVLDRFIELAGGPESLIVVLPTALADPVPERLGIVRALRSRGAKRVEVLRDRRREDVESARFLDTIGRAGGVWFGGGRQWRFVDAYLGTKAHRALQRVLERGGVIGGSSAGASIQASYLARGNPLGNRDIMAEGYERGLGFLRGVAIDQHFTARNRFADMASLVERYPDLLGIGVDEAAALVVRGREREVIGEVIGKGAAHFYDGTERLTVRAGGGYDLKARRARGKRRAF